MQSGEAAPAAAPRGAGFLANFGRKEPAPATVPPSTFQISNGAGGSGREADLARREAELARREAEVQQLAADAKPRNWPSCCPLIYHNIAEQIPSWNRSFVRFTYLIELLTIAGFFYNCLIVLIAIFARVGPGLNWWFISMLCLVMGVPLSWWLFYKSVFNSAQTDGGTYSYMKTFLLIMIHMAWAAWMVVAAPNLGTFSAGIFPMMDHFSRGGASGLAFGIMYIINIGIWGLVALGSWVVLGLAVAAYRRGDEPRRAYEERHAPLSAA